MSVTKWGWNHIAVAGTAVDKWREKTFPRPWGAQKTTSRVENSIAWCQTPQKTNGIFHHFTNFFFQTGGFLRGSKEFFLDREAKTLANGSGKTKGTDESHKKYHQSQKGFIRFDEVSSWIVSPHPSPTSVLCQRMNFSRSSAMQTESKNLFNFMF